MPLLCPALLLAVLSAPPVPPDADYVPLADAPDGMGEAVGLAPPGVGGHLHGVSLFGAEALPSGHLGLFGGAGFPYLTAEALYGVARRFSLYARFDSLYSIMEQVTLGAKWTLLQSPRGDALAVRLEANQTFFEDTEAQDQDTSLGPGSPPDDKQFSARWLTGQRNEGAAAALVLSTRYPSGITLFFDASFDLTVDTEPLAGGPLSGNPPPFTLGFNTPLHAGLELPVSRRVNLVVMLGSDLHFRRLTESEDSIAIPFFSLGCDGLL